MTICILFSVAIKTKISSRFVFICCPDEETVIGLTLLPVSYSARDVNGDKTGRGNVGGDNDTTTRGRCNRVCAEFQPTSSPLDTIVKSASRCLRFHPRFQDSVGDDRTRDSGYLDLRHVTCLMSVGIVQVQRCTFYSLTTTRLQRAEL